MKKRYKVAAISFVISVMITVVSLAGTGPAYPEVPAGERTSNLAENQDFVDWWDLSKIDSANGQMVCYDMYGKRLKGVTLAGGTVINEDGYCVWDGAAIDGSISNLTEILPKMSTNDYGWKQELDRPVNENGVSNWYYKAKSSLPYNSAWTWLSDQDNPFSTKKAYCFNEYGYLYVNTITPDGFIVNERGQMITEDGLLIEHEIDASTHDPSSNAYVGAPIGIMRETYFTVCNRPICGGRCFTGEIEKENPNRISIVGHPAPEAP